jgi:hypothetical protein
MVLDGQTTARATGKNAKALDRKKNVNTKIAQRKSSGFVNTLPSSNRPQSFALRIWGFNGARSERPLTHAIVPSTQLMFIVELSVMTILLAKAAMIFLTRFI